MMYFTEVKRTVSAVYLDFIKNHLMEFNCKLIVDGNVMLHVAIGDSSFYIIHLSGTKFKVVSKTGVMNFVSIQDVVRYIKGFSVVTGDL